MLNVEWEARWKSDGVCWILRWVVQCPVAGSCTVARSCKEWNYLEFCSQHVLVNHEATWHSVKKHPEVGLEGGRG